jgi:phosphoglycerol transferase MdoB-like AlkP superfamily enzyme
MNKEQQSSKFADLLKDIMNKRWYITAMVLGLFILITAGIFIAILIQAPMAAAWKELLMLLLGAFIGSYGKIIDYYYSDSDKDKMLVQKADEEDGVSMSHTNDMKETNKPVTPLIPDAFIQGAQAARELAVVENKQNYDLTKDEQEHRQILEVDEQEHEQEMAKLKLEHELKAHRYCQHEWGDSDNDGELECQKCGLLKDSWDESH